MLESIFTRLFFMSIQATLLIMVIIGIRVLCPKLPKKYICLLWCLAALRLILPVNIETAFGLMPSVGQLERAFESAESAGMMPENMTTGIQEAVSESSAPAIYQETVPDDVVPDAYQEIVLDNISPEDPLAQMNQQESVVGGTNGYVQDEQMQDQQMQVERRNIIHTLSILWAAGVLSLLGYGAFSYIKVKHQVREAVYEHDNVWLCDRIDTPFLLGYIKPRIYMPFHVNMERREYIIAHEQCHIARKDHIAKLIGYILLAVYWFQPFVWISYVLFCRDVEMACDESVIAKLGEGEKRNYTQTLLMCSVDRRNFLSNPLAFGEVDVKKRIQNVLHYKKPGFWIICGSIILVIVVALLFMTGRNEEKKVHNASDGTEQDGIRAEAPREKWTGEDGQIFMYSHRVDITHDGVMDLVVFTIEPHPEAFEELPAELENYMELDADTLFQKLMAEGHIYVYKGSGGKGNYEEVPLWHRGEIYWAHVGNTQISVLEENGKGYLLESNMYEGMEYVDYSYKVFSLDGTGEEVLKEEASVSFYAGDFDPAAGDLTVQMPEEAVQLQAFQEKMAPWLDSLSTVLLVATDLSTEPCVFWSEEPDMNIMYAREYYQLIWNRWFASEIEPSFHGYIDYTGYMDMCKIWTDYENFVDQDYDGDGLVDRVYRKNKKDALCDYRIELGNGDVILLENAGIERPVIKPEDLNRDGIKEIIVAWDHEGNNYLMDDGNVALFEKTAQGYRKVQLPFTADPKSEWRVGLTVSYDFGEGDTAYMTVEETGTQVEVTYNSIEGIREDYSEIIEIEQTRVVQGEDGPYLECKLNGWDRTIELKLVYEDGEYRLRDLDIADYFSEDILIQTDGAREYFLEINGSDYLVSGKRHVGRCYVWYVENGERHNVQSFEEENIQGYTIEDRNEDGFPDFRLQPLGEDGEPIIVDYIWNPEGKVFE